MEESQLTFSHDQAGQSHAALVPILAAVELLHPVLPDLSHQRVKSIFHTLNANTSSGCFSPLKLLTSLICPSQSPLMDLRDTILQEEQHPAYPVAPKRKKLTWMSPNPLLTLLTPPGVTTTKIIMETSGRFHAGNKLLLP